MTLRVVELFAGIGAQAQALENLGLDFESIVCEIDEKAYRSYCAIHGDTSNLGDITKVEHLPECDLLTYSFPCQDLSIAGNQNGMKEGSGTRSSLLWEVGRLLADAEAHGRLPDCLLMENVDAILNKKNLPEFNRWIAFLTGLGYTSEYEVLNAKDFGVPQNRKRCFMVSALRGRRFQFPEEFPLEIRLRDVLEDDVDESFYLSEEKVTRYRAKADHGSEKDATIEVVGDLNIEGRHELINRVYGQDGLSPTIPTGSGGGHIPKIEIAGHIEGFLEHPGRVHDTFGIAPAVTANRYGLPASLIKVGNDFIPPLSEGEVAAMLTPGRDKRQNGPRCKTDGTAFTVTTQDRHGIAENDHGRLCIRYLTPRECWRLMGFPDEAFDRASAITSKTQLYKQAGNSIVVQVLEAIFRGMYIDMTWKVSRTLEEWI